MNMIRTGKLYFWRLTLTQNGVLAQHSTWPILVQGQSSPVLGLILCSWPSNQIPLVIALQLSSPSDKIKTWTHVRFICTSSRTRSVCSTRLASCASCSFLIRASIESISAWAFHNLSESNYWSCSLRWLNFANVIAESSPNWRLTRSFSKNLNIPNDRSTGTFVGSIKLFSVPSSTMRKGDRNGII